MPLNYFLINNHLTPDPNDQTTVVTGVKSYNDEEIAERMLRRGSTVTKADILAVFQNLVTEISYIVSEGDAVNSALIQATPSISGKFNDVRDSFDPSRHKLNYNLRFGKTVRDAMRKTKATKVATPETGPIISMIRDSVSGQADGTLTSGGSLEIFGSRLKVIPDMEGNGAFFIGADGTEYPVVTLVDNKPSRLIVLIPTLPAGDYILEVRTNFSGSSVPVKQIKIVRYAKTLAV